MSSALGGLVLAKSASGSSSNLQLATITTVGTVIYAQVDGATSVFTLIPDANRIATLPATVGDRVLCTRQGSSMYEIALVASALPTAKAYAAYTISANQSLTDATPSTILWNSLIGTRVGFTAPTGGVFTTPVTGRYAVTAKVSFALGAAISRRYVAIFINNVQVSRVEQANSTTGQWHVEANDLLALTAGDTISVQAFQNSGAGLNATALDAQSNANATMLKIAQLA